MQWGYFFTYVISLTRSRLLALIDCICDAEICLYIVLQTNREAVYWKLYTCYTGYTMTDKLFITSIIQSSNAQKYFIFKINGNGWKNCAKYIPHERPYSWELDYYECMHTEFNHSPFILYLYKLVSPFETMVVGFDNITRDYLILLWCWNALTVNLISCEIFVFQQVFIKLPSQCHNYADKETANQS